MVSIRIIRSCLENGSFQLNGKKLMWFQHTKKELHKQNLKNYCPISLLPVAGQTFERKLNNNIYEFFSENNLISQNQSGFKPVDSCINQLLSISHETYKSLGNVLEVRGIFLDISKPFGKVWHKGLLYKRKQNSILRKLFDFITDFLNFRKQRVVLNG